MAKFESKKLDLVVSSSEGFITFKNGGYTTTNKKEIEALRKALDVEEIGGKPTPPIIKDTPEKE